MIKYTFYALIAVLLMSCKDDEEKDYTALNEAEITAYIAANNLDATKSETGLYYVINNEGTGTRARTTSNVTVAYKGYYSDGKIFDQNNTGISFNLQNVIAGWTEGITYFKEGGNGILLVPSHLGYGSSDSRGIPGGSVLIFDVSLISVN